MDETMVITRSNKRANIYNQGIRNTVLDREDELCRGDQLMIVKNNYYWTEQSKEISFLLTAISLWCSVCAMFTNCSGSALLM